MCRHLICLVLLLSVCVMPPAFSEDAPGEKSLDQMSKEDILATARWQRAEEALEEENAKEELEPADRPGRGH